MSLIAQTSTYPPPAYPSTDQLQLIAKESIVLLTFVVGLVGAFILVKWGLIPLGKIFVQATSSLAEASKNLHDGIRDNLTITERLHDMERSRKDP